MNVRRRGIPRFLKKSPASDCCHIHDPLFSSQFHMRRLQNANLAFHIAVESFTIPNRAKIPPFHWSPKHSLRLQTISGFSGGRHKRHACFQSRRRFHHHPPCSFSHFPHTPQAADERSLATAANESSSPSKETYPQPPEPTHASAFPQTDPTLKDVAVSPGENQWPSVAVQAHPIPTTSTGLNTGQDEDWWEEAEEEHSTGYDQSPGENRHVENSETEQKLPKLHPRTKWWRKKFNVLQSEYFRINADLQDATQLNQTEDPYSIQSIEWRSIWFDQPENEQPADFSNIASADNRRSSTESVPWLLRHHPDKAVRVLWCTFTPRYPNVFAVLDTLKYLSAFYFIRHPKYTIVEVPTFVDFFLHFLRHLPQRFVATEPFQRIVHLILTHSNKNLGLTLFSALQQKQIRLHLWTKLHFAHFFAREGLFKLATEVLEKAKTQELDITSFPFLSNCNKILRSSLLHPEGYRSSSHLVSRLMDMGVQFDRIFYNVLLANAVEAGDLQTATQIFELIERSDMGPDNNTWSIILNGCKKCHNPVVTDHIMSKASSASLNCWAATDLIHCVSLHSARRNSENIYSTVSKVYQKYFDTSPLQELGISLESSSSETTQSLFKPPPAAIGIMLTLFLRYHGTPRNVIEIYNRFRVRILNGSSLVQLTLTDYTYNAFLYKASRWPTTLRFCTDILRDMSTALPDNVLPKHPKTDEIQEPAAPTVRTWSILLQAFVLHDRPAAAEKVLDLMQQRGLKPNSVMWNSIVNAYARSQDARGLMDAIMRREKSGFGFDKYTRRALKRFKNREELVELLNKEKGKGGNDSVGKIPIAEYQQSQSMTTEAKSFAEERNRHESEVLNTMYPYNIAQGFGFSSMA